MAAHAAFYLEQVPAAGENGSEFEHAVAGVALHAAGFGVGGGKQRPQPVLVIAVRLLRARGSATVAVVAGRAAETLHIVESQQRLVGVADEKTLAAHVGRGEHERLPDNPMGGLATNPPARLLPR